MGRNLGESLIFTDCGVGSGWDTVLLVSTLIMNNPLGKTVGYPDVFDPHLLFPIARAQSRMQLGLKDPLPFIGVDRWTCYELSWLDRDGVPRVGIVSVEYPASSPMLVESKSLKLFLGSMNFTRFADVHAVEEAIRIALEPIIQVDQIKVSVREPREWDQASIVQAIGECVDHEKPVRDGSVRLKSFEEECDETIHSNLLRSLCPVTSQPDWGTLVIRYRGRQLDRSSLISYLIAHRSYQGFHEECCERVFVDLVSACAPRDLWVGCFYTRRGGIDINPERWLPESERLRVHGRLPRQ